MQWNISATFFLSSMNVSIVLALSMRVFLSFDGQQLPVCYFLGFSFLSMQLLHYQFDCWTILNKNLLGLNKYLESRREQKQLRFEPTSDFPLDFLHHMIHIYCYLMTLWIKTVKLHLYQKQSSSMLDQIFIQWKIISFRIIALVNRTFYNAWRFQ